MKMTKKQKAEAVFEQAVEWNHLYVAQDIWGNFPNLHQKFKKILKKQKVEKEFFSLPASNGTHW